MSEDDVVEVWFAEPVPAVGPFLIDLSPAERARANDFRRPIDAARFVTGATVVRRLAGAHLGTEPGQVEVDRRCLTCPRPHGRVVLPQTDLFVSVSHSGALVGVAVYQGAEVGLDVEAVTFEEFPGRHVLAPVEADQLTQVPPEERPLAFLRYWTRKEALLKLTGDGLRLPMTQILASASSEPAPLVSWAGRDELVHQVWMYDLPVAPGYVATLAVQRGGPVSVRIRHGLGPGPDSLLKAVSR